MQDSSNGIRATAQRCLNTIPLLTCENGSVLACDMGDIHCTHKHYMSVSVVLQSVSQRLQ